MRSPDAGYVQACTRPLLIVGVARNIDRHVAAEIGALQSAFAGFTHRQWLIVESDSTDRTVEVLQAMGASMPGLRTLSLGHLRAQLPLRTDRIAHCRNRYLQEIDDNPLYAAVQWVVVADLDGTNHLLDRNAVASCWRRGDWDVCCANQRGLYYDIWALRHPTWSPDDCWARYRQLVAQGTPRYAARWSAVYSRMRHIASDQPWIAVDSAFGGLAIYRRSVLSGVRYCGVGPAGEEVCEHIALHAQLRARGHTIMLNPALLNLDESEHTRPARMGRVGRWLDQLRCDVAGPLLGR